MSVNNTTTNPGFFKRIGNWFNKNGNTLGQSMQLAGSTAMGVGLVGMMFHEMNKSSCCHHNRSIFGGGFGGCMSPWNSWNMGGCGMFGGMNMLNNMYSMTNPYLTMAGLQSASNYGFMNAMMARQNMYTNPMNNPMYQNYYNQAYQNYSNTYLNNNQTGINDPNVEVDYTVKGNEAVELTDEEMKNTDDGDKMDTAFNNKKSFKYAEKNATADEMKAGLEKYAKSYVAYVDTKEGDSDKFISEDEFVEHESNGTQAGNLAAKRAFKQFDLNNDDKLDWQEYASVLKTYDQNNDGTINAEEYKTANELSAKGINDAIRRKDGDKDRFRNQIFNSSRELGYNE